MILITGSKGKVGKSLVNYLKKNKLKIVETQRSKNYRKSAYMMDRDTT